MISKMNRIRTLAAAAALSAAVALAVPTVSVFAATGTITGSDINVRSEASSDSSQVGTVTTGDTVTVGDTETDSSGATWYQVTLSNGTTGYVRGDFLTVDETDEADAETTEEDATTETTEEDSTEADSTDSAAADAAAAAEQDTGGYQVVLAPDENGDDTYYLYDNNAGQRMKISDISKLQEDVNTANQQAASTKSTYTVFVIVLAATTVIFLIGCIVLFLKLRDALANGRRERDLTMERRDQRRNDHRADSVESLRRPRAEAGSRSGRGRDDAYASGAGRRIERDSARDPRDARSARPAADRRPVRSAADQDDYAPRTTRAARPAADAEGRQAVRSARPAADGEVRRERTARPAAAANSENRQAARSARPAAEDGSARRAAAPAARQSAARQSSAPRQSAAKNVADEDFDYDFLKMDDDE